MRIDIKKTTHYSYWKLFVFIVFASFSLFIINIFVGGSNGLQFDSLFLRCGDLFADLANNIGYASHLNPYNEEFVYGSVERIYPPMVYLICYCISRVVNVEKFIEANSFVSMTSDTKLLFVLAVLLVVVVILSLETYKAVKKGTNIEKTLTAVALVISYPFIYSLERGNYIILSALLNLLFLFFHDSENKYIKELALLALAFSSSIKFPAAFLGILLIYEKEWKEALRTVAYGLLCFIIPMLILDGGINNIGKMLENIALNINAYSPFLGCTFPAVINTVLGRYLSEDVVPFIRISGYIICAIMLISIPFVNRNWQRIGILCLVLTIAPSHSGTYCLMYLFPLIIAFLNEKEHMAVEMLPFAGICLLVVYDPSQYAYCFGIFLLVVYTFICSVLSIFNRIIARKGKKELQDRLQM